MTRRESLIVRTEDPRRPTLPERYPRGTACQWQLVRLPNLVQMGDGRERFVVRWWGGKYAWYAYFTVVPWPGWRFQFHVRHGMRGPR